MKINLKDIEKIGDALLKGKEIDFSEIASKKLAEGLSKEYGKPKMFIITFMIHTRMSDNVMAQLTDKFVSSIPSEDWSKNIMTCDISKLVDK